MRILSGRTPVRSSGRNPRAIRFYVYTVKNPSRTYRVGDYVEPDVAREMSAKYQILVLLSLSWWTTIHCCYNLYSGYCIQKKRRRRVKVHRHISQLNHLCYCLTNSFRDWMICRLNISNYRKWLSRSINCCHSRFIYNDTFPFKCAWHTACSKIC